MDRFIAESLTFTSSAFSRLKSNMDRFIEFTISTAFIKIEMFKIQYG